MGRNRWVLVVVGVLVIIASTVSITYNLVNKVEIESSEPVVIAQRALNKGEKLTEDMLLYKYEPKRNLIPNVYHDKKDVVGKIIGEDIYPGEYILSYHLEKDDVESFDSRIIALPVSLDGGAVGLSKGDLVDIFSVNSKKGEVRLFLPKVKVLELRDNSNYELGQNQVPSYIVFQTEYDMVEDILKAKINSSFFIARYGKYSKPDKALEEFNRLKGIEDIKEDVQKEQEVVE